MGEGGGPEVGTLGALWVSAQLCLAFACCVPLTSHCPSLSFHSSSIKWNDNVTLLRQSEGQIKQPEGMPTGAWCVMSLPASPAFCTHHMYIWCVPPVPSPGFMTVGL